VIRNKWYCAYPSIRECAASRDLAVREVHIDEDDLIDLGLGRSIYRQAQVKKFLKLQDFQGTWRAYLAENAELAYGGCSKHGSRGLKLCDRVRESLIDAEGWSLVPLYRLMGP
jgi:hypothetical protein